MRSWQKQGMFHFLLFHEIIGLYFCILLQSIVIGNRTNCKMGNMRWLLPYNHFFCHNYSLNTFVSPWISYQAMTLGKIPSTISRFVMPYFIFAPFFCFSFFVMFVTEFCWLVESFGIPFGDMLVFIFTIHKINLSSMVLMITQIF